MKLLIVVLCYKVVDVTIDCLRALDPEVRRMSGVRVVVCENGSGGDAANRLSSAIDQNGWTDWCELQVVWPNLGFTGGNNHVILASMQSSDPPQYVLLLNSDTLVHPHSIETLVNFMDEHPKIGVAGSRLEFPDESEAACVFRFQGIVSTFENAARWGPISRLLNRWQTRLPAPLHAQPVDWVAGACMIIRREVIDAIGGLDEGYYTYFDDIDYCLNAWRAGWPVWFVPESRVIHLEGMSTGLHNQGIPSTKRRPEYWFHARRRYFLKNYGPFYAALVDLAFIIGFSFWRIRRSITRKPDLDPAHVLYDFIRYSVFCKGFRLEPVPNPALKTQ